MWRPPLTWPRAGSPSASRHSCLLCQGALVLGPTATHRAVGQLIHTVGASARRLRPTETGPPPDGHAVAAPTGDAGDPATPLRQRVAASRTYRRTARRCIPLDCPRRPVRAYHYLAFWSGPAQNGKVVALHRHRYVRLAGRSQREYRPVLGLARACKRMGMPRVRNNEQDGRGLWGHSPVTPSNACFYYLAFWATGPAWLRPGPARTCLLSLAKAQYRAGQGCGCHCQRWVENSLSDTVE